MHTAGKAPAPAGRPRACGSPASSPSATGAREPLGSDRTRPRGHGAVDLAHHDLDGAYGDDRGGFLVKKITKTRWGC